MDYCYDVWAKFIKPKSKDKHFNSNTHEEFDRCKHMEIFIENPDMNNIDEVFYAYIILHKNKMIFTFLNVILDQFLMKINVVNMSSLTYLIMKQWFLGRNFQKKWFMILKIKETISTLLKTWIL